MTQKGKKTIVTGGSRGIGNAIVPEFLTGQVNSVDGGLSM
jgi:NAD(P)-dependent dehydrogenase (short-subunit alcohol dehydrogenase family)